MKIYGKTLPEILAEMGWPQKVVLFAGSIFLFFCALYLPYVFLFAAKSGPVAGPISINNELSAVGVLDPSLATDGKANIMAYSVILPPAKGDKLFATEIHLATANASCEMWTALDDAVIPSRTEEIIGPDGLTPVTSGIWRIETPSIIHDPSDSAQPWKMFAYKYFWTGNTSLARLYSFIVFSHSANPANGWSTEEWLFSANGASPPAPYNKLVHFKLNMLSPELSDIVLYTRPSALEIDNIIFLSLSAYKKGQTAPDRIVLIASSDHGKSWAYLGAPLRADDLVRLKPYRKIGGATLIRKDRKLFLSAVLADDKTDGTGAVIFSFQDIAKAELRRDAATGAPVIANHVALISNAPSAVGGGAAAYEQSASRACSCLNSLRAQTVFKSTKLTSSPLKNSLVYDKNLAATI